jgi:hypothetical protein
MERVSGSTTKSLNEFYKNQYTVFSNQKYFLAVTPAK